eukprot:617210-Pleurochrysis_carterae.AAC.2
MSKKRSLKPHPDHQEFSLTCETKKLLLFETTNHTTWASFMCSMNEPLDQGLQSATAISIPTLFAVDYPKKRTSVLTAFWKEFEVIKVVKTS